MLLSLFCIIVPKSLAQNGETYKIFDAKGNAISYKQMMETLYSKQVVFFGEMHNNPICHWLEYVIADALYQKHTTKMAIGTEMFETDNQLLLDEVTSGIISQESFEKEAKLWPNYETDYIKLIELSIKHKIPFVGTNIPRRYANLVSKQGFDAIEKLSAEAKKYIVPMPIKYQKDEQKNEMFKAMGSMMGHAKKNPEYMTQAQAIKDATMAYRIAQTMDKGYEYIYHVNGSFHSDVHDGIIPYLKSYKPGLSIATISCCSQDNIDTLEEQNIDRADFIIAIPSSMVTSY